MTRIASFVPLAALALLALPPTAATAQPAPPPQGPELPLEYAAKYVCGTNPLQGAVTTLAAAGNYYTAVNIHNPFKANKVTYKVALAPQGKPGPMTGFQPVFPLSYDQAMDVDCRLIRARLQQSGIPVPANGFITGFLVIESSRELDVVAVYTAAPTPGNQVSSIHTERVPVRRVID
ncbi:MAG: hypothetical protein QOG72_418 [Sphingomonadales bacterium]|jgi:hypothetical protein|nr:hypothetical protein [Sphingomonadales bacterium]